MRFLLRIPLRCSNKTYPYKHWQHNREKLSRMGYYAVVFIHSGFGCFVMFPADVSRRYHAALHSPIHCQPPNALFTVSTSEHTIANNGKVLYCYGYDVMGAIWHTEIWEHGKTVCVAGRKPGHCRTRNVCRLPWCAQAACGRIFKSNLRSICKRWALRQFEGTAFFNKRSLWFAANRFQFSHSVTVYGGVPLGKKVIVSLDNTDWMKYCRLTITATNGEAYVGVQFYPFRASRKGIPRRFSSLFYL